MGNKMNAQLPHLQASGTGTVGNNYQPPHERDTEETMSLEKKHVSAEQ